MVDADTVTTATSPLEESATLVATTWYDPAVGGAVYLPDASTVPPAVSRTSHVTSGLSAPLTVAVNVTVARAAVVTWCGATTTVTAVRAGTESLTQPAATTKLSENRILRTACIRRLRSPA